MLLFAKDLVDVEFVSQEYPEDAGFLSAVARFKTLAGAHEARDRLNGKANAANDANMIVEVLQNGFPGPIGARRNTIDIPSARHASSSTSSVASSNGQQNRQSSRFNGTFQSMEKRSPPNGPLGSDIFPGPESNTHIKSLFTPKSPVANSLGSSKSMINDDAGDDGTEKLLNDPVAYAKSGESNQAPMPRRITNPQLPISRFAGLSLSTAHSSSGMASPPLSSFASPRSIQSSGSTMSPTSMTPIPNLGPNTNYQLAAPHYQRHNYPPVNPADQNPPCNTLYVGNLPMDTSEDELKAMFSKQRGYKRLCFRTKQNGPMCFVEFEDVSFATKALNELYGHPLHNSVKGGIRLSFSKNPLGVRSGQNTGMGPPASMTPHAVMPAMSNGLGAPPGFATATGPPPGLAAPPGLNNPMAMNNGSTFPMYGTSGGFGVPSNGMASPVRAQQMPNGMAAATSVAGGGNFPGMSGDYAYMMGR